MDLYRCSGVPIYASLPHFYDAHESYLKGVVGLKPNKTKHEIRILFESGVALNSTLTKPLKLLFMMKSVVNVLKYLVIVGALGGLAYSGYLFHKGSGKINITPVHKVQPNDNHSGISSVDNLFQGNVNRAMSAHSVDKY
ncbi:unnamed protein product [Callosobruchus maculatus]|uniref:Uncharacterized protein n=1 Tax=Callosobruchus maculatus TaxID=64391 RepID=A0A653BWG9_CALMS|nr:unnamed protein product [Callosobruchus maculatus]